MSRPLSWVLLSLCCAVCEASLLVKRGRGSWVASVSMEALEPSCLGSAAEPTSWIQTPAPCDLEQALFSHQTDRAPSVPRSCTDTDCSRVAGTTMKLLYQNPCVQSPVLPVTCCVNQGKSLNLSGPQPSHVRVGITSMSLAMGRIKHITTCKEA